MLFTIKLQSKTAPNATPAKMEIYSVCWQDGLIKALDAARRYEMNLVSMEVVS